MEKETFYKICTRYEDCRIDFFINAQYILYVSNYYTKGMVLCCDSHENWIEIIKDRGYWDYFYRKIMKHDYERGEICSELPRKCIEQFIQEVKKIKL